MTASNTRKKTSAGSPSKKTSSSRSAPRAAAKPRPSGREVAADAPRQLLDLTGKATEGVVGLERTDDGWRVQVEVLELRRIPNTTDVIALYEIDADESGAIEGYRRVRRYVRGSPGEE